VVLALMFALERASSAEKKSGDASLADTVIVPSRELPVVVQEWEAGVASSVVK
jgi:hypothetical protein